MKTRTCNPIAVTPNLTLYHTGPALDLGPLPSLFYFAISGPDSLCMDPFNQPVQFLQGQMIRIFSLTLPGHENDLPAKDAMKIWADDLQKGRNCIAEFLDQAEQAVTFAIEEKFADPSKMATAGLSRGGFIAAHLAARESRFRHIACFAPMTRLAKIKEFAHLQDHSIANSFDLVHLAKDLSDRHIQLYIGNEDTRVGTSECFDFAMSLVKHKKTRTAPVELLVYPSIGQMGHGTPPEIFQKGANWIAERIK
jgi:predicted esterase